MIELPARVLPTLLLVLSAFLGASQTARADSSLHLKRVNLVVADLDRSLTVYRDILGFKVFEVSESPKSSYSYPVFNFPKRARSR